MKTRPILFSSPMVRALLADSKTQTRRIVKGVGSCTKWCGPLTAHDRSHPEGTSWHFGRGEIKGDPHNFYVEASMPCPYGMPGDRLWVRETWGIEVPYESETGASMIPCYRADGGARKPWDSRWRPSIHMPRAFSRLTLEITDVRVERLQAISEADVEAEGIQRNARYDGWDPEDGWIDPVGHDEDFPAASAKEAYRGLWESINGPGSWDANPWVWAPTFKRVQA